MRAAGKCQSVNCREKYGESPAVTDANTPRTGAATGLGTISGRNDKRYFTEKHCRGERFKDCWERLYKPNAMYICANSISILQRVRIARNADRCNSHRLSDRPSLCPSITVWCFVQTNENAIVRSPASGRTIFLVS